MPRTPRASRDAKRGHAAGRHRRWQSRSGLRKTSLDAVDIAHANASPSRYVATAMLCLGDMTVARANCDSRSRACGGVIIGPRAPCQIRSQATPPRHPPGRGGPGPGPGRGEIPEIRKFRKIPPRAGPAPGRQNGPKIGPEIGVRGAQNGLPSGSLVHYIGYLTPPGGVQNWVHFGTPGHPPGGGPPGGTKSAHFFGYLITLPVGTVWRLFSTPPGTPHFGHFGGLSGGQSSGWGRVSVYGTPKAPCTVRSTLCLGRTVGEKG